MSRKKYKLKSIYSDYMHMSLWLCAKLNAIENKIDEFNQPLSKSEIEHKIKELKSMRNDYCCIPDEVVSYE
jgi:hypothetical protein